MSKTQKTKRSHYYLVTGEITFTLNNGEEFHQVTRLNCMLTRDTTKIQLDAIGKAQQSLQVQLHNMLNGEKFDVANVVILNISYLGHMTHEEFNERPDKPFMVEGAAPFAPSDPDKIN